jgi:hypothetical protein
VFSLSHFLSQDCARSHCLIFSSSHHLHFSNHYQNLHFTSSSSTSLPFLLPNHRMYWRRHSDLASLPPSLCSSSEDFSTTRIVFLPVESLDLMYHTVHKSLQTHSLWSNLLNESFV